MKSFVPFAMVVAALAVAAPPSAAQVNDPGRLYGRVVTMDGEEFEGFIRWGGKDGREFVMRDSNDVNDENKGIFIELDDGEMVMLEWDEFERVEFQH